MGQTWSGPGCPMVYPGQEQAQRDIIKDAKKVADEAAKYDIQNKCNSEQAKYRVGKESWVKADSDSWNQHINYGIEVGEVWDGTGCPQLYSGQEQAQRDLLKKKQEDKDKAISNAKTQASNDAILATQNKIKAIGDSQALLKTISLGGSVQCTVDVPGGKGVNATYRLESGNTLRWYPTPDIARSWNSSWDKATTIPDCSTFTLGSTMSLNTPQVLPAISSAVKCGKDVPGGKGANFAIYRLDSNGTLRHYPTDSIARSWDPNYAQPTTIADCSSLILGPDMTQNLFPDDLLTYGNNGTRSGTQYCALYRGTKCIKQIVKTDATNKTKLGDSVGCDVLVGSAGNAQLGAQCSTEKMVLVAPYDYANNDGTVDGYTYCKGAYESPTGQNKNLGCSYGVVYGDPNQWNQVVRCDAVTGTNTAYKCEPRVERDWNACNPFTEVSGSHRHDDWCRNDLGNNYYHAKDGNGCGNGGWHGMCRNYIE